MTQSTLFLRVVGAAQPLSFAASELSRYIARLTSDKVQPAVVVTSRVEPGAQNTLWLVCAHDAPAEMTASLPAVADAKWDDAFSVNVRNGEGYIIGVNPRSVLIGAYALLRAAGCRWVRPGKDGEVVPMRGVEALTLVKNEAASYRHRGICIEGACSYENIADIIDWAPKVGYNAYFTQFRESYTFFDRWYSHLGNPNKAAEPFTVEMARTFLRQAQQELARRGMLYHAVGHGWTCEPFGLAGLGWESREYEITPEVRSYLAEVNGQRGIWHGVPLNTNLCYSNPTVRRLVNENIVEYAAANPQVDVLHFWLADDSNNQCECENCRQALPSDWYVQMLNELDAMLTARGVTTRIVFLIYVDLLWPPEKQRLVHQDRFILMFAPITRSYTTPFSVEGELPPIPPYHRNRLQFPKNVAENVAFLRGWQAMFSGDSFDFDYHLMWDHFNDPGYTSTARILGEDARRLKLIGLNGYMSCQLQRIFFPTALPMVVLGQTLWNDTASFEDISRDFYDASFGADGSKVQEYLATLSALFYPPYLRGERPVIDAESAAGFSKVEEVVRAFKSVIAANQAATTGAQARSWEILDIHGTYCIKLAAALRARAEGDQESAQAVWKELVQFVWDQEDILQPVLDTFLFVNTLNRRFTQS